MAGTEPGPVREHPAGSASRPRLLLVQGGRDAADPIDLGPRPGVVRRFLCELWEAMIASNGEFPSAQSWFE